MPNEFVARKGLIIKEVQSGSTETQILVEDANGLVKYRTDLSLAGTSGSSGTNGTSGSSGTNGTSGTDGTSGSSGNNGTSGSSGTDGTSGSSGTNGTSGSSGTGFNTISNPGDNRILTSDGSANAAYAETNLNFDGSKLGVNTISPSEAVSIVGNIAFGATEGKCKIIYNSTETSIDFIIN